MNQPYGYGPPPAGPYVLPPAPTSPAGQPLADFGTRVLAYLIDTAIIAVAAVVLAVVPAVLIVLANLPDDTATAPDDLRYLLVFGAVELGALVLILAIQYVYYVEMMFRTGQTIGKRVMNIRVTPIDPGHTLTRGMAVKRYLIEVVCGTLVGLFHFLDGLWQLWDKPFQQTLHDKVARTVVIKVLP